jgi:hypothetical protein
MATAKITAAPRPKPTEGSAEALIAAATQPVDISLADGTVVRLRKPDVLAQFRLIKALGPETAANQTLVMVYMPYLFVAAIDGEPVAFPTSERQMEAIIMRLGYDGVDAVALAVAKHWGRVNLTEEREETKN